MTLKPTRLPEGLRAPTSEEILRQEVEFIKNMDSFEITEEMKENMRRDIDCMKLPNDKLK